jgi:hypothetical protein
MYIQYWYRHDSRCKLSLLIQSVCLQGLITPLHLAVQRNYRGIVVILCQGLADPNLLDKQGCTALHYIQSKTITKVSMQ